MANQPLLSYRKQPLLSYRKRKGMSLDSPVTLKGTLLVNHYGSRVSGLTLWRYLPAIGNNETFSVIKEDYEYNAYNLFGRLDIICQHTVLSGAARPDALDVYAITVDGAIANGYSKVGTESKAGRIPGKPYKPAKPAPPRDHWDLLEI